MTASGDAAGYELAYRAGIKAVEQQAATLRETRDRTGALMSTAAVAGGLAASLAFTSDRAESIGWLGATGAVLAVAGFTGVVLTTVLVWRPTEGRFILDAGVIVGSYVEGDPPLELPELHRELALWLGIHTRSNREMLEVQLKKFTWGLGLLLLEMVGVILALGDVASG